MARLGVSLVKMSFGLLVCSHLDQLRRLPPQLPVGAGLVRLGVSLVKMGFLIQKHVQNVKIFFACGGLIVLAIV